MMLVAKRMKSLAGLRCRHASPLRYGNLVTGDDNVRGLPTFWALYDFEFDRIPFLQGTVTVADNRRVMNKDIGAFITPDKAIPLRVVEPLHCALHVSLPHRTAIIRGRKRSCPPNDPSKRILRTLAKS